AGSDSGPWLTRTADEQVAIWQKFHREQALPALLRQIAALPEARRVVAILSQHVPDHPVMRERRSVLLEKLPRLASVAAADVLHALETIRAHAQVQRGGGAKAWDSADTYEAFKTAATKLRETIDKLKPLASFDAQAVREAAEIGQKLLTIATRIAERFDARKRELAVLDFDDLLRQARALLVDPRHEELRRQLSGQIRLLLVDEFQDTDRLQVDLVTALAGVAERKLFFVGDYKQSIYRFRGADPDVFRRLRDQTPAEGRLELDRNFRSQPAIVHFVNALFWHDLENYEPLRADRPQQAPEPAVEFLWAPATAEDNKSKELWRRREAEWIARRVRQILDDPQLIVGGRSSAEGTGEPRRARPGDIAILFRALSNVEYYEDALRRHGIDYYLVGGHAFYAQQEVFDLLNLLRALASPSDEVSLLGALRSGFFALTDETIFWLAQHPDGLLAGLSAADFPPQLAPEEADRAWFAASTLAELRADKDRLPIYELIEEALAKTGYDAALVSEFMGERKLANLRKLVEQARSFDRSGFLSLADFISQLSEFIARQPDEPLAATQGENMDAVRLMTIHQAKGLEFPIVIIPDLDRPRFTGSAGIHFDAELGPLVKLRDDGETKSPASGYDLWRLLEKELDQAELARLLYVATTRAADYLILASSVPELGSAKGPWTQMLARRFDLLSGLFGGELPPDEPRPKIKITSE
ncbi:MAG TPA: 3'-5' exonuclease, partial [Pirellulales bacterium]|nr:3'-5' exonuclease [Pirellulales bacterium]